MDTRSVDGYLVIYSLTDRASYRYAQSCLAELRPSKRLNAVILVANKADVVRNRLVSTAGRLVKTNSSSVRPMNQGLWRGFMCNYCVQHAAVIPT